MFELEKEFNFEGGHTLKHHDGKCSYPHGHSYKLVIKMRGDQLISNGPKKNMLIDFGDISKVVKPMIEQYFDHHWINDTLNTDSPSAEFIAKWIFDYLQPHFPSLYAITVQETETSKATYCVSI